MLERLDKHIEKSGATFWLPDSMIESIRRHCADIGKTQSKYIHDLVEADLSSLVSVAVSDLEREGEDSESRS